MGNINKKLILLCFIFIIVLSGCYNRESDNIPPERVDEQYAVHELENGELEKMEGGSIHKNEKEIKITPSDKDYNDFVSIFTYEPKPTEKESSLPKEVSLIKKITFYQVLARGENISSKNRMESIMQLDIYYDGKDYYGVKYLTYLKEEKTYFKIPIKRINLINSLEKRYS